MTEVPNPVRVELLPRADPRIYDAVTGEDVTLRVRSLELFPHREGVAILLRLRDGKPYVSPVTGEVALEKRAIATMSVAWENLTFVRPEEAA